MTMFKRQAVKNRLDKLNTAADSKADAALDAAGRKIEEAKASKFTWVYFLAVAAIAGAGVAIAVWIVD